MNDVLEVVIALTAIAAALLYFGLSIAVSIYMLHSIDAHILAWGAYAVSQVLVVLMIILNFVMEGDF